MPETHDIIRSTAGFLATALGSTWRVDPEYDSSWGAKLEGPDGLSLLLNMSTRGKVEISGFMPANPDGGRFPNTHIGVSRDRGPEAIAREITRRLLPPYREE